MRQNNSRIDYRAVFVIGLVAFSLSLAWYSPWLFGDIWLKSQDATIASSPMWKFFTAPLREIVTGAVLSFLIVRLKPPHWRSAFGLGLVLWFGFYVVQLTGAVIWDNDPWQLSAVHAGDWLMKTLFMTVALSAWHVKPESKTQNRGQQESE